MVLVREAEPGADHPGRQRTSEVLGEVGPARVGKLVDEGACRHPDRRLEALPDRGRVECVLKTLRRRVWIGGSTPARSPAGWKSW